jgi:predicted glutamine amidotransferase
MFLLAMAHVQRGTSPIEAVQHMLAEVRASMDARGIRAPLRFAAALSDGQQVFAFRYASDDKPPSLYVNRCDGGTVVASEPLQDRATECCPEWTLVPPNTAVTVLRGTVASQPLTVACLDAVT